MAELRQPRAVERLIAGQSTQDGAGVKLTRVLTRDLQRRLDPFLMLDAFASDRPDDYLAGFPEHPHRGFETITVMIEGRMRHRDSAGHEGLLESGGMQWMSAGRGVVHSEFPEQSEGRMEGFQLWLNLPSRDKLGTPWYRDIPAAQIPLWRGEGAEARLLAGERLGQRGAVQREATQPLLLDVALQPGAAFEQALPETHNAFFYVYRGSASLASGCQVPAGRMAILANTPGSDGIALRAGEQGARLLLVAGQPLHEPIAQYGPFVMNTEAELLQAVRDYQAGRFAE